MEQGATNTSGTGDTSMETQAGLDEFIATGRTGRRNAMPDILDSQTAGVGTGGLAFDMEKLNCSDGNKSADGSMEAAGTSSEKGS